RNTISATTPMTGMAASTRRNRYPSIWRPRPLHRSQNATVNAFACLPQSAILRMSFDLVAASPDLVAAPPPQRPRHPRASFRRVILADRHRADARELHIRQPGLLGPNVELRLHLGEVALGFDFL